MTVARTTYVCSDDLLARLEDILSRIWTSMGYLVEGRLHERFSGLFRCELYARRPCWTDSWPYRQLDALVSNLSSLSSFDQMLSGGGGDEGDSRNAQKLHTGLLEEV